MRPILDKKTGMNKTETKYSQHLGLLTKIHPLEGERLECLGCDSDFERVLDWRFEPMGLKLAREKCFYYPDFLVVYRDRFEFHEVKAFNRKVGKPLMKDDSLVKIKVAATEYSWFNFKITFYNPQLGWEYRSIK